MIYEHPLAASAGRIVGGYRASQPENQQVSKPTSNHALDSIRHISQSSGSGCEADHLKLTLLGVLRVARTKEATY